MNNSELKGKIASLLNQFFRSENENELKELKTGKNHSDMCVSVESSGVDFLSYQFDKDLAKENYPYGLFPFFNRSQKGTHSMCDYVIFCLLPGELYILLIELKKGGSNVTQQLNAGKCFVEFVIATLNRLEGLKIHPVIRMVSVRERNKLEKGTTKQRKAKYDKDGFVEFFGATFNLNLYCVK